MSPDHFTWLELSCWNRLQDKDGTFIEWNGIAPHGLIAVYPLDWREERGARLRLACEDCREELGNQPLIVDSAFRTDAYNAAVGGRSGSWHKKGKAADLRQRPDLSWESFKDGILRAAHRQGSPIRYIKFYPRKHFAHIDVRDRQTLLVEEEP